MCFQRTGMAKLTCNVCRCRLTTASTSSGQNVSPSIIDPYGNQRTGKAEKISKAMMAYLDRARKYDAFMKEQITEFEIGKRHLANMMGKDPETFNQDDIDEAIRYLLPSSLFDKKARPVLRHPEEIFPRKKAAQFGIDGRPFHSMFYTGKPHYYQMMHEIVQHIEELNRYEDDMIKQGYLTPPDHVKKVILVGSEWISREVLQNMLVEKFDDRWYNSFVILMERLANHPYASRKEEYIMKFRKIMSKEHEAFIVKEPEVGADGRRFAVGTGRRKSVNATVKVTENGKGKFTVNGASLLEHFGHIGVAEREQIAFPLQFTDMLLQVDVEATVVNGGPSGQAGATRYALSNALMSFVDAKMSEKMRLAGLLTEDPRRKERKKPGQKKARKKPTWKKR